MLDPEAAQFRGVQRCTGDAEVWNGEANGKNTFGAYTGFKPFFYSGGVVAYTGDTEFMRLMERCYSDLPSATQSASAPTASLSAEPSTPAAMQSPVVKARPKPATDADEDRAEAEADRAEEAAKPSLCWADYCPCDTTDPDFGFLDVTLCRKLKMGMPVSKGEFSIGASGRDARKALREDQEKNGSYNR